MLGFTDEVTRINRFLRWWSVNIERYLLFTKFMMETLFFTCMYADPNMQRYRRAMSRRAGNRDERRYIQEMVNSWLSAFTYSDCVCHWERIRMPPVARVPRVGHPWFRDTWRSSLLPLSLSTPPAFYDLMSKTAELQGVVADYFVCRGRDRDLILKTVAIVKAL